MNLLIIGAGRFGQFVKELAQTKYAKIQFLDDNPLLGFDKIDDCINYKDEYEYAIVAIGENEKRLSVLDKLESNGFKLATIVSDKAFISPSAHIAEGCVIEPMVVIKNGATIDRGVIVSAGTIINFNSHVCKGCHLDSNSVVGLDVVVPEKMNLMYGQLFKKVDVPDDWKFSE